MKFLLIPTLLIQQIAAHAIFQQFWVNGVDKSTTCIRMPRGNSPVTSVNSNDMRCNSGGATGVSGKCAVNAGDIVAVEMHQQPGDRSCKNEAIGGNHYGPVLIYMSKVADASKADGSAGWFKVYEDGWAAAPGNKGAADNDYWGVKDMNTCCGKVSFAIPKDLAPGDYLVRAEVVALHTAQSAGGAQFYMSCYQVTVAGSGSLNPATVKIPGIYASGDPGIKINIHSAISGYTIPGPKVIAEGTTVTPGNPVCQKKAIRGVNDIFGF